MPRILVSRRDNLDDGNNSVMARVADDDCLGLCRILVGFGPPPELHPRLSDGEGYAPRRFRGRGTVVARTLQGEDVRTEPSSDLFGQGVMVGRQQAAIQRAGDVFDPAVVEVMKDARLDTGPIVNRHGAFL